MVWGTVGVGIDDVLVAAEMGQEDRQLGCRPAQLQDVLLRCNPDTNRLMPAASIARRLADV